MDTSPSAARLQIETYRALGASGRLRIALGLSDLTHAFALAGIRQREPGLDEEEARRRLSHLLFDPRTRAR